MWKTIIRRVLLMIPQILILSILIFILADFMPGDPFTGLVDPNLDPAQLDAMREAYGLNDPLPVKYVRWMKNALQGDFGRSFNYQQPVTAVIAGRMGNTIRLSLLSIILTYLIGLPLGILAGRYNESILDKTVLVYNFVSFAVPIFVLALLMVWVFGYNLNWFPARGSISVNAVTQWDKWMSQLYHLLLPSITTAILGTTSIIQYLRSEIIDAKVSDYVKTARSKGVPIRRSVY